MVDQAARRRRTRADQRWASSERVAVSAAPFEAAEASADAERSHSQTRSHTQSQNQSQEAAADQALLKSFIVGLLEQAVNKALRQDADALADLRAYAGCVFRIKTYQPYSVIYCQFCDEGITLLSHYDGEVDARVQAPAGKLLMLLLQQDSEWNEQDFEIKILGDRELVEQILALLKRYDIWRWVRQFWLEWFPGANDFPAIMDKLQMQTPEWWAAWQALPVTTQDVLVELKHVSETQTQMLAEIKALRLAQAHGVSRMTPVQWLGVALIVVGALWFGAHLWSMPLGS